MKQMTFKQKVVQGIYDLFYVWKQELRNLFRDQGVLIFFVLVPLTYPLIYSFIYTNETVREVPAVVGISEESGCQSRNKHRGALRRYGRSQTHAERAQGIRHHLHTLRFQR